MSGSADKLVLDDWNAVCFECGRKKKASQLKRHWRGYWVCPEHWEPREAQDFVRSIPDVQTPPWTQPRPADTFVPICSAQDQSAYPRQAIPGCVKAGFVSPFFDSTQPSPD